MGSSTSKRIFILLCHLCAIIILCSSMSHGNSNAGCNAKDRETLEIFKGSIKDPWKLLSSWSTEQDCCHWFGVRCGNLTRRVTRLDLHCHRNYPDDDKCLGGQINLYVLKLEFLSFLDLHDNDFNAIYIPPIDHNMSIIRHGTNLSNLSYLDFSNNYGLRIDDLRWVSQLSSLKYLNLTYADLSKETLWLQRVSMLPSLLELRLRNCSLNSIQPSLEHVNSSSLEVLDISRNEFYSEVMPEWLFNLSSSISFLDLGFSYLKGQMSKELSNFRQLKHLVLRFNNFEGSIPEWVGQYKQLEHLDISGNFFSGPIPETLVNLSSLVHLDVECNSLNGSLPKSLGQLSELRGIFVGNNLLSGSISPFLCQVMSGSKKLEVLRLSHNDFSGELSQCWIHWKKPLKVILLPSNNFSGSIPPQICKLSSLQILDLANNKLSGSIPKCLGNIAANPVISDLNQTIVRDSHLIYRQCGEDDISYNHSPVVQLVFSVDLSMNDLSGSIPRELFRSVNLIFLNLSHNGLMGSIPYEIGNMGRLEALDLSWNQLVGEIPQSMTDLNFLTHLNLSYNNLSGEIPLGTQLQCFEASSYMGNPELHGIPLTEDNSQAETPNSKDGIPTEKKHCSDDEFTTWVKMGMAIGFTYGFWGTCLTLFFIKTWRIAYFRFLTHIYDQIYVFVALKAKWLRRNLTKSAN